MQLLPYLLQDSAAKPVTRGRGAWLPSLKGHLGKLQGSLPAFPGPAEKHNFLCRLHPGLKGWADSVTYGELFPINKI